MLKVLVNISSASEQKHNFETSVIANLILCRNSNEKLYTTGHVTAQAKHISIFLTTRLAILSYVWGDNATLRKTLCRQR
jgi:hypothetical protein